MPVSARPRRPAASSALIGRERPDSPLTVPRGQAPAAGVRRQLTRLSQSECRDRGVAAVLRGFRSGSEFLLAGEYLSITAYLISAGASNC